MAYLVDENAAERSRNHPTKLKAAKRTKDKQARRKLKKQISPYVKRKSGPVTIYKPSSFFDSREWKELRYKVLAKYGATCQCCGATRKDGVSIHVDHIKPRSRFPHLEWDENNLQILCEPCNIGKGAKDLTDWR